MSAAGAKRDGLGQRSVTAMLWGTGGSVLRILLQVVTQIVLARILGPELYGVFAVALVVVALSSLFADVGLAYGLIQRPTVTDEDIRFIFTWQIILGVVVTALVMLAAPVIAARYEKSDLVAVIMVLAPTCLINAAAATSGALLRRQMDFKSLNIAAVVSYAIAYVLVAIPLALAGAGVMALAVAFVLQSMLVGGLQYRAMRHALRPLLWQPEAPGILRFGGTVLATNLVNWAMTGLDRAIAGSALGLAAAGLYATAYNLISAPLLQGLSLIQSVFYSASSKVQDDHAQLGRGLTALFAVVVLLAAPVFVGVAAAAETLFVTIYGSRWTGGGAVLAPLALAMPAFLLMGLATPVLWASGATRREFELQVPLAIAWGVVLWIVTHTGSLLVLAWTVCALFLLRAGVIIWAALHAIRLSPRRVLEAIGAGLAATALVGLVTLAVDRGLAPALGRGIGLLAIDVAAAGLALLVALRLVGRWVEADAVALLDQVAERLAGRRGQATLAAMLGR